LFVAVRRTLSPTMTFLYRRWCFVAPEQSVGLEVDALSYLSCCRTVIETHTNSGACPMKCIHHDDPLSEVLEPVPQENLVDRLETDNQVMNLALRFDPVIHHLRTRSFGALSFLEQEPETEDDGTWTVVLEPDSKGTLGLIMRMRNQKGELCIEKVEPNGPAERWNRLHPEKKIHSGDMVVEVNGVRGDLQELAAECRQLKTFHLRLQRPRDVSNSKLFAEYAPTVPRKNVVQGKSTSQFHDDFCSSSPSEVSVSECASRPQSQGAQSPKSNSGGSQRRLRGTFSTMRSSLARVAFGRTFESSDK